MDVYVFTPPVCLFCGDKKEILLQLSPGLIDLVHDGRDFRNH